MITVPAVAYDGEPLDIPEQAVDALRHRLTGSVALKGERAYDESRTIWNAMIDRRPALAVRCVGTADIMHAVRFAREHGIALTIRGGGHNIAGLAVCEGGLLLDLSPMRAVFVDPGARTAHAQPGCLLSDLDRETQLHGLAAVLGFVSNTGATGLTLGGGFGYLTRQGGWSSDTVRSIRLVTADGELVTASAEHNTDLFWGLRGGGGNFGVVTDIEYGLLDVGPEIIGGAIAWRAEDALPVLEKHRELMRGAPAAANCMVVLRKAPPAPWIDPSAHGQSVVVLLVCHTGSSSDGEAFAAELKQLGNPVGDVVQRRPYASQQCLVDGTQPFGRRNYWKSDYLSGLDTGLYETALECSLTLKSPHSAIAILPLDGALNDLPEDHSAAGHRDTRAIVNITASWDLPDDDAANIEWARQSFRRFEPFSSGGTYVNFLTEDEPEKRLRQAYGTNYERLVQVKRQWDPDNFFRYNKNIVP
jgi:FAD/FMN-containing dehydrogenase